MSESELILIRNAALFFQPEAMSADGRIVGRVWSIVHGCPIVVRARALRGVALAQAVELARRGRLALRNGDPARPVVLPEDEDRRREGAGGGGR